MTEQRLVFEVPEGRCHSEQVSVTGEIYAKHDERKQSKDE